MREDVELAPEESDEITLETIREGFQERLRLEANLRWCTRQMINECLGCSDDGHLIEEGA